MKVVRSKPGPTFPSCGNFVTFGSCRGFCAARSQCTTDGAGRGGKADLPRVKSFCGRVEGTTSSPAEETAGRRDGAGLIEGSKGGTKWSIIISSKKTRVVPLPVYPRL